MNTSKLAFVGLGAMGAPMAAHLLRTFGAINVYNRTPAKALTWREQNAGGKAFDDLSELAQASDVVFLCVGNDDDVRHTVQTMLPHLKPASVIVDHTTTSRALAQEMAALCASHQVSFLDCPVSGGQAGAQNGVLTIMAGGDEAVFEKIRPFLQAFSKHQQHFGVSGNGQSVKMVNQVFIASLLQGLSEGIHLAEHLNLDIKAIVETLSQGAAGSWQLANRGVSMSERRFDFGFAVDWMIKDLGIVTDFAHDAGLNLPQTEQVKQTYEALSAAGHHRDDTSALIRQFDKLVA
jgi:3-hydroxyisobutyrate dehydrogenase-like beta-hydroxyacid dehydrogenase